MPRKPHTRHRRKRTFLYLALLALLLTLYVHWENHALQVSHFDVSFADLPAGFDGCRIAVLGDLLENSKLHSLCSVGSKL